MGGISLSVHRLESTITVMLGPAKANITPTLGKANIITPKYGKIGRTNIIHLLCFSRLCGPWVNPGWHGKFIDRSRFFFVIIYYFPRFFDKQKDKNPFIVLILKSALA
jgi:hypothetical protein